MTTLPEFGEEAAVLPWKPVKAQLSAPTDPLAGVKPKIYMVAGKPTKFYGIGALARALNRQSDTIRKWETNGWIPKPTAVFNGKDPRDAISAKHGRRRLYTREQILGLVKIAFEEGILEPHARPITETDFTARAKRLFADLVAKEKAARSAA
ncbi:hypothetical protein [Microbispora sp. NPDC049633]|uniref:hypothetical protein n=1 Tax=Microbispora sp. NPDC049633 TaxID=3154355 RepID=UPI0034285E21